MDDYFFQLAAILLLAGAVQGTIGFGFGLVSISLIVLVIDIKAAVPLIAIFSLLVQIQMLLRLWAHIQLKRLRLLMIGALVGAPIGVTLLNRINSEMMMLGLGIFLVLYVLINVRNPTETTKISENWGLVAGLMGGILGGAFNTSGPPVVVYVSMQKWGKDLTTATLQGYFFLVTITQILSLYCSGLLDMKNLILNAKLSPFVLMGVALGGILYNHLDREKFRTGMLIGILLIGTNMIWKNI